MNKHTLLRILCGLTFLIFLCPFFQMCSDKTLTSFPFKSAAHEEQLTDAVEVKAITDTIVEESTVQIIETTDTVYVKQQMTPELKKKWEKEKKNNLREAKRSFTFNVYELNLLTFKEEINYGLLPFVFLLLLSILQFIMAIGSRFKSVYILAILNILFSAIFILFFYLSHFLEEFSQIKYGYYLFIINTFAITLLSKKLTNHGI